jgi:hypothetical protein
MDATLENHWNPSRRKSCCHGHHVTVAKFDVEDRGCNDIRLQECHSRARAPDGTNHFAAGVFDCRLQFKRYERLIFDNQDWS